MKLSSKIAIGYGLIIVIAIALGVIAVFNMLRVETESNTLSSTYLPAMASESDLELQVSQLMFAMRGYNYTENKSFYEDSHKLFDQIEQELKVLDKHCDSSNKLSAAKSSIEKVTKYIQKYRQYLKETAGLFEEADDARITLQKSSTELMHNSAKLLKEQNGLLHNELNIRKTPYYLAFNIQNTINRLCIIGSRLSSNDQTAIEEYSDEIKKCQDIIEIYQKVTLNTNNMEIAHKLYKTLVGLSRKKQLTNLAHIENELTATAEKLCESEIATNPLTTRLKLIALSQEIIDLAKDVRIISFKGIADRNFETINNAFPVMERMNSIITELRADLKHNSSIKFLNLIQKSSKDYATAIKSYLSCQKKLTELAKERVEVGNGCTTAIRSLVDHGVTTTQNMSRHAASLLSSSSIITITGLIVAVIVSVFLAIFITLGITKSINLVINGLHRGSEEVTSASEQVSSSSQSLAQGANEQAVSLEEISSSIEEMASMTRQNADNAKQATSMSAAASDAAQKGAEAMTRMGSAIEKIKDSSEETAKIIKTIDEIAFQTNLLALNAAVEAARAGEAGKGFAVVAEEVRNLAQRSAEAAKNTSALIAESQQNADNGVSAANEVDQILKKIVDSSVKVAELINEVNAASSEQSIGVDQINKAVTQLDKVTQGNAANAEQSASASEELSLQAVELKQMIGELTVLVEGTNSNDILMRVTSGDNQHTGKRVLSVSDSLPRNPSLSKQAEYDRVIPLDSENFGKF